MKLQSKRLTVVLQSRDDVEQMIEAMPEEHKAQVSAEWMTRMRASEMPDPWVHGFRIELRDRGDVIGSCAFKGPPENGIVEIAYAIDAAHQRNGYATEAAQALVDFASSCVDVRTVRAHTMPDGVASQRVLAKCGLQYVGEIVDPEDGIVSRFEKLLNDSAGIAGSN